MKVNRLKNLDMKIIWQIEKVGTLFLLYLYKYLPLDKYNVQHNFHSIIKVYVIYIKFMK